MLIEDDLMVRDVLEELLRDSGFDVVVAGNAAHALSLASLRDIDVLVTDIVMPDMDGFTLAHRCKAIRPDLRIQYISGHPVGAHPNAPTLDGKVLIKPFRPAELIDRINSILGDMKSVGAV
jgi:DNA-binding response OmpR family regulator